MRIVFRWILSAAATIALITVFAEFSQKNQEKLVNDVTVSAAEAVPLAAQSSEVAEQTGYVLREYEDRLAVFLEGDTDPLYVFNVSMSTMSDYDKTALKEGIAAQNIEELKSLVEDYTS